MLKSTFSRLPKKYPSICKEVNLCFYEFAVVTREFEHIHSILLILMSLVVFLLTVKPSATNVTLLLL